jgi:hypothetical protein
MERCGGRNGEYVEENWRDVVEGTESMWMRNEEMWWKERRDEEEERRDVEAYMERGTERTWGK